MLCQCYSMPPKGVTIMPPKALPSPTYNTNIMEVSMKIQLKDNHVFKNTVDGVYVEVGGESVEVSDKVGQYLLKSFPDRLEVSTKIESKEVE